MGCCGSTPVVPLAGTATGPMSATEMEASKITYHGIARIVTTAVAPLKAEFKELRRTSDGWKRA
jgi:hypothetical protein